MRKNKITVVPKKRQYKRVQSATIISEEKLTLLDGRAVRSQVWEEGNRTFTTYFFSNEGLEDKSKEELFHYLVEQGIQVNGPFSMGKVALQKFLDENKQQCWGLTVINANNS
jgi:hypothetical protein